jgi:hypothetical protein
MWVMARGLTAAYTPGRRPSIRDQPVSADGNHVDGRQPPLMDDDLEDDAWFWILVIAGVAGILIGVAMGWVFRV